MEQNMLQECSLLCLHEDADDVCVGEALAEEVMKIYLLENQDGSVKPTDVGIVIEGITVLKLVDFVSAFAIVVGLPYSLNIQCPKGLKYYFETVQKMFLHLGDSYSYSVSLKNVLLKCERL
uniref:Uncharacterized protein n=1 Tax=Paramormyrops kingsleyae TaxID=1676925 RepID=A0A3B3QAZ1_9TELE